MTHALVISSTGGVAGITARLFRTDSENCPVEFTVEQDRPDRSIRFGEVYPVQGAKPCPCLGATGVL